MERKLVCVVRELREEERKRISEHVSDYGYEACFFDRKEEAYEALKEAEILISADPSLIPCAPNLKWVCTPFAGADSFFRSGVLEGRDVILSNSSGAYGIAISEHVVMTVLELLRRSGEYAGLVKNHIWKRDLPIRSIYHSHILILGTGNIGSECARRLRAFEPAALTGVNRTGHNPSGFFDIILNTEEMMDILPETDIVILALPGTENTFHLFGEKQLQSMKTNALLINIGRGTVIDQKALIPFLQSGKIIAGLDVFETEPIPEGDPLWDCPNLLITPHCSGNYCLSHTLKKITDLFLEDFDSYIAEKPLKRLIDRRNGY